MVVNIAPDNLDATTVMFESMLLNIPIVNIRLQKNSWSYNFEKIKAVHTYNFDSEYKERILELINNQKEYEEQVGNIKKFLNEYLVEPSHASENLVNTLVDFRK